MKNLDEIREVVRDPYGYAKKYKAKTHQKIVGYSVPMRRKRSSGPPVLCRSGFSAGRETFIWPISICQSYCCSLVRSVLEEALSEN